MDGLGDCFQDCRWETGVKSGGSDDARAGMAREEGIIGETRPSDLQNGPDRAVQYNVG